MIGFDRRGRGMHKSRQVRPSENVGAKKAEIARRYSRERRPSSQLERILSLRRSQIIRLFKYRDGLHDDEAGRADLRLLLDLGLSGPEAMMVAPWISPGELQHLIDDSNAHPRFWKPDALGNRVELTFEEKVVLDIRNINCFDRPKHQVTAFYKRRRREREAERKRRRRAAAKKDRVPKVDDLSPRAGAIFKVLRGKGWMSTHATAAVVSALPAFESLTWDGMRQAIGRAVRELIDADVIEVKLPRMQGFGSLGYRSRLIRRLDESDA
jgi:hypothetical protein